MKGNMIGELKGDCQRCGEPITFPIDLNNTESDCPHCHKVTTLLAKRPESKVRKAEPPPAMPGSARANYSGLGAIGIACSILLPIIGFFIGIYLLTKGQNARGCVCMALSVVSGLGWFVLMNS